jgi:hypothetical protein
MRAASPLTHTGVQVDLHIILASVVRRFDPTTFAAQAFRRGIPTQAVGARRGHGSVLLERVDTADEVLKVADGADEDLELELFLLLGSRLAFAAGTSSARTRARARAGTKTVVAIISDIVLFFIVFFVKLVEGKTDVSGDEDPKLGEGIVDLRTSGLFDP